MVSSLMPHPGYLCGVILSAGASTRMGQDKALLPWPPAGVQHSLRLSGQTFLSAAISSFLPYTEMVIVVAGNNVATIEPIVYSQGASLIVNPEPKRGQFSSLRVGLHELLNRGRDAAIVTLVDRPPVSSATINLLREALSSAPAQTWAVVPEHDGKHGHPFIIGREMIEAFLKAPAESTARDVEHKNLAHIRYVPVDDPFTTLNIDTPQDYAALVARSAPG